MRRGRFITFEGGEGVGKSTQARLLADALAARGLEILLTREPGGTAGAEAIRGLLLAGELDWNPQAEALLFAAARADHVARLIRPALEQGTWVICDRFLDSSRAYQGGDRAISDEDLMALHRLGSGRLMPDITFLLYADKAEAERRLATRDGANSDRIGGRPAAYHADVAERYRTIAAGDPARVVPVDATGTLEEVHMRILHGLAPVLGEHG